MCGGEMARALINHGALFAPTKPSAVVQMRRSPWEYWKLRRKFGIRARTTSAHQNGVGRADVIQRDSGSSPTFSFLQHRVEELSLCCEN